MGDRLFFRDGALCHGWETDIGDHIMNQIFFLTVSDRLPLTPVIVTPLQFIVVYIKSQQPLCPDTFDQDLFLQYTDGLLAAMCVEQKQDLGKEMSCSPEAVGAPVERIAADILVTMPETLQKNNFYW